MRDLRRRPERPLVYGHRGAAARAPENTLRSFALALDEGADGVELDVRTSRDGVVVVCHDPVLERLAHRPDRVAELDARTLGAIDVGGDRIPTLDEVLDLALPRGAIVNVEVKGDVPDRLGVSRAVARLLARRSDRDRDAIFLSSFRPEMLAAMRLAGAGVPTAFLYDLENTGAMRAAFLRRAFFPAGLHPQHRACSAAAIARWHLRGLFVNAWTVDDPALALSLAAAGIDGIITNDPAGALAVLGGLRPRPASPI